MKWASAITYDDKRRYGSARQYLGDCVEQVRFQLSNEQPDLAILFVSSHFAEEYDAIPELLKADLAPRILIGCTAGGLIGGGIEIEHKRAVALTAAVLPDVRIEAFHITDEGLPDLDDAPDAWEKLVNIKSTEQPNFILLPDPFSFQIDTFVQGLDFAFPSSVKLGGLASGANRPGLNALFCNDRIYHEGAVGVWLAGNLVVDSVVAQGCRPIGHPFRVTNCQNNFLFELDGKAAVHALKDVLDNLSDRDQTLARNSLFLGVVMDEFKDDFKAGDFLIRNIIGIEPRSGALVIGEVLRNERTVQFHLRDAATSADDLRLLLKQYCQQHGDRKANGASGALLFSCLGRGEHLYGSANHDSDCFREYLGEIPLGGFFCNGEIGPVGGTTFLHGYTSSFGIFREKANIGA